ncbi:hypothetical protein DdX_14386 [Ditylenchus destructor]|uniref:Uncharacterized protein n=1 Tax=Ditylenchus destructor TaxID=166010 RepID=A0AAD4R1Z5_9BILA|nr:hypothetical protein DdX_14386 [Ditylenchus destructor]
MSIFYALIISYPLRKWGTDFLLNEPFEGWDQVLIDMTCYTSRTLLLVMLHKAVPQLSAMDVLALSYPFRRLWEVVLGHNPMYSWKLELSAVAHFSLNYFLGEILFWKAIGGLFQHEILESVWWLIYFICTCMMLRLLPVLPLRAHRHER